jgi:hypothetical protein
MAALAIGSTPKSIALITIEAYLLIATEQWATKNNLATIKH